MYYISRILTNSRHHHIPSTEWRKKSLSLEKWWQCRETGRTSVRRLASCSILNTWTRVIILAWILSLTKWRPISTMLSLLMHNSIDNNRKCGFVSHSRPVESRFFKPISLRCQVSQVTSKMVKAMALYSTLAEELATRCSFANVN